jgi:hypothetical protein
VFQHEIIRSKEKLHIRVNIPGSYQADFSGGESIPGLSISRLLHNLLKIKPPRKYVVSKQKIRDLENLDSVNLLDYENELWASRVSTKLSDASKPGEIMLIKIRNILRISAFKHSLESFIISREMGSSKSRIFVEFQ